MDLSRCGLLGSPLSPPATLPFGRQITHNDQPCPSLGQTGWRSERQWPLQSSQGKLQFFFRTKSDFPLPTIKTNSRGIYWENNPYTSSHTVFLKQGVKYITHVSSKRRCSHITYGFLKISFQQHQKNLSKPLAQWCKTTPLWIEIWELQIYDLPQPWELWGM